MEKKALTFFLILIVKFPIFSQVRTVFEGPYEFKGKLGEATFEYREGEDGEIIMDGFFRFDAHEIDSVDQTFLTKLKATGNYNLGQKEGGWTFDKESHKVYLRDVVEYEVITDLESEDIEIKGQYEDHLPEGRWDFIENIYQDGKIQLRAGAENLTFSQGLIIGDLYFRSFIENYTQFVRGSTNADGFMQGEWSMVYLKDSILVSEVRNYENGFLLGVVRRDLNSGDILDEAIYYGTISKLRQIQNNENEGFFIAERAFDFKFNDGFREQALERQIQNPGNDFLERFVKKILQFDDALSDEGELVRPPFRTRRFEFEFTKEEEEMLLEIPVLFDQIKDTVIRYHEMNSLELNKSRSDSLAFAHSFFETRVNRLERIENLIGLIKDGDIRYYDLQNYTREGISFMSPLDVVTYDFGEEENLRRLIQRDAKFDQEVSFFENLKTFLEEEYGLVESLANYVDSELYEIEVNTKLLAVEEEIVSRKSEVDSLFKSYQPVSSGQQRLIEEIGETFLEDVYQDLNRQYAAENEFENKIEIGNIILNLFDELERRFSSLLAIHPRMEELDEIYMEETFNPFTYSRYDVRAKERLYDAGKVLFDYYLEQLKEESDYTRISDHIQNIARLQDRMLELRSEDTRALERRLGRRNAPGRIESALDL